MCASRMGDVKRRRLRGYCEWSDQKCPSACPIDAIDNFGNPYKACALVRLKSLAEMDAEVAKK